MSSKPDVVLPNQYALVLLRKLADDDAFRYHYQANPAKALSDIGVPQQILATVPSQNLQPIAKLADKSVFLRALLLLIDELACVVLCHSQPQINIFSPISKKNEGAKTSFEGS